MNNSRIIDKLFYNARTYPDEVAISMGEDQYTFKELCEKASEISTAIGYEYAEKPIAVFANRKIETVLYFMAVIMSGNYYVPIDPEMPKEKMRCIFEEICPAYVFADAGNIASLQQIYSEQYSVLNENSRGDSRRDHIVSPDCPLYMIYTSGSTGKPKGVLKTHGAMASFMETFVTTFSIGRHEVIGNQTPFYFDASAKDIYLMIENASRLIVIPSELFVIPPRLMDYLNRCKITFISWVPTALSLTAQIKAFNFVLPRFLKRVFFVGEVMPVKSLNYWIEHLPDVRFVNLYGQSEIAGVACYYEAKGTQAEGSILPIGKPLPNCRVFLMDGNRIISGQNEVGEITISSAALAKSYYCDPEKTQQAFVSIDGKRAFRTGDYAFYDERGDLVFTARKDSQIKHLGRRIELGEIEAIAGAFEGMQRCCCLYDQEKKKIALFCQVDEGIEIDEIKSFLSGRLSSYMMPEKITIIEKMPINANGKIDRQLLKTLI